MVYQFHNICFDLVFVHTFEELKLTEILQELPPMLMPSIPWPEAVEDVAVAAADAVAPVILAMPDIVVDIAIELDIINVRK